jgi:hypothetical protein
MTSHTYSYPIMVFPAVLLLCAGLIAGVFFIQYDTTRMMPSVTSVNHASEVLVSESTSASTNSPETILTVYQNGSAALQTPSKNLSRTLAPGTVDVQSLQADLNQIGDITATPSQSGCIKSASFGTRSALSYQGKTNNDISCASIHIASYAKVQLDLDAVTVKLNSGQDAP